MSVLAVLVALASFVAGAALVRFLPARRDDDAVPAPSGDVVSPESAIPFCATADALVEPVAEALDRESGLRAVGLYAARDGSEALDALWRAADEAASLPAQVSASLILQLPGAFLLTPGELASGRVLGLPAAAPEAEAAAMPASVAPEGSFSENPFDLDDSSLTGDAVPAGGDGRHARVVAIPWHGPFGRSGLIVARRGAAGDDLARSERVAARAGERIAVCCEIEERTHRAEEVSHRASEPPASPAVRPVEARRRRAEARMIEALQAPRREADLVRNTVQLLAEGLGSDRCYAVEVAGFRALPVAQERRSEAAASAVGIDLGEPFLEAVRARSGPTIKAITLDAARAAEQVSEAAGARLGPVSRMLVPVIEKGRVALVYVAEWIDLAKQWNDEDVAFAERVVARSAVARERILQFEALAEQAAHAHGAREEIEQALEQLQSIVAALPHALVGLDDEGRITFVNRTATQLFNTTELELIGRWMTDLAAERGYDAETWRRALAAETPQSFTLEVAPAGRLVEVAVVPNLPSSVCSRLVSFSGQ
jgi:PAS domain S-box-containing protein